MVRRLIIHTYRQAKRLVIIVIGFTVFLVGIVMIALPGPGLLVIPAGLAILATEFVWARRLQHKFKETANHLKNPHKIRRLFQRVRLKLGQKIPSFSPRKQMEKKSPNDLGL